MGTLTPKKTGVVPRVPWKVKCLKRHRGCLGDTMDVSGELIRVSRGIT